MATPAPHPDPEDLLAHTDRLRGLIRRLVIDDAAADDVLQDTHVAALTSPPADRGKLAGWLRTVARNFAYKQHRGRERRARREEAAARPESEPATLDVVAALEWQQRLTAAVLALDEPYRSTVVKRYLSGLDAKSIAVLDDISEGAVNARLRRALETLRRSLDRGPSDGTSWRAAFLPLLVVPELRPTPPAVPGGAVAAALGGAALVAGAVWFAASSPETAVPLSERATVPVEQTEAPAPVHLTGRAVPAPPDRPVAALDPSAARRRVPDYLTRIHNQDTDATAGIAAEILALDARKARDILTTIYPQIERRWKRLRLLQAAAAPPAHRFALAILRPGLDDPDAYVRGYAYDRLAAFGYPAHADDPATLAAWWSRYGDLPVAHVLEERAIEFVERTRHLGAHTLAAELTRFGPLDRRVEDAAEQGLDLRETFERLRFPATLADIAADSAAPIEGRLTALLWLEMLDLDERTLRERVRPLLDDPADHPGLVVRAGALLVGRKAPAWALASLLHALLETPRREDWSAISRALAVLGDPAAVPTLIAVCEAAPTSGARSRVARNGLAPLLGVAYRRGIDWRDASQAPIPVVQPRAAGTPKNDTEESGR